MKKVAVLCKNCGRKFYPERKSGKFCGDNCRVAYHRAKQERAEQYTEVAAYVRKLGRELDNKETCFQAAVELQALRKIVDMYAPIKTQWWRCDVCQHTLMKFVPDFGDCACGVDAKWYIVIRN